MKISELKQPYRRMAEYLAGKNTNKRFKSKECLYNAFPWDETDCNLWCEVYDGNYPEITEEIKSYFPMDFDFSGEVEDERRYNFAFKNNMEEKYTQLAKEGKFEELPETCEFSEAVKLEVWDDEYTNEVLDISGKFKGFYMFITKDKSVESYINAQLPTPKIDFSEYKIGDVVEVETKANKVYYGMICNIEKDFIKLSFNEKAMTKMQIWKPEIKSIKKLK